MIKIIFPDDSIREYKRGITAIEIARDISEGFSRNVLSAIFNKNTIEISTKLYESGSLKFFTWNDSEGKKAFWHSSAHVLAQALLYLYPNCKLTIGPAIDNGFYYDADFEGQNISESDLKTIEKKILEFSREKFNFKMRNVSKKNALEYYKKNKYKTELIQDLKDGEITFCDHADFTDLCKGGHIPHTGFIKSVKLLNVAGAYWRGNEKNKQLTRIYGISFPKQKELNQYLSLIEEAKKRDHRKLGKEMDLFHFREESPGSVFWHSKGWSLFQKLIDYMRAKQKKAGYNEINTPELLDRSLWEKSGHWDKFGDLMFTSITPDDKVFAIKPMNCPGCVQVFNQGLKSYRDLPLKLSEFGKVHRYESSGALHGLLRVRAFTQDDAHIFCTEDQITDECLSVTNLILEIYKDLGFTNVLLQFSDRPQKRVGDDKIWDKAETALLKAIKQTKLKYEINKGEGAFYGPKIDFVLRDSICVIVTFCGFCQPE